MDKYYKISETSRIKNLLTEAIDKCYELKIQSNYDDDNNHSWVKINSEKGLGLVLSEMTNNNHFVFVRRIYGFNDVEYLEVTMNNIMNTITIKLSVNYLDYFINEYDLKLL